jgi:protein-L-isoaspartate(D-aspartate) O-methyltransferase
LRAELVAHLRKSADLSDARVAAALGEVPRHVFVPWVELPEAYADQAVPTRFRDGLPTSSASQPAIVAAMLELLRPPIGGTVLEIGAGTGYNAALLSELVGPAGHVVTIDIDPEVAEDARAHLVEAGITNVNVICGDGFLGWSDRAPYDGIVVTASASDLAPSWLDQLGSEGRLVVPLSIRGVQHCIAFARSNGRLSSVAMCECGFMPLVGVMGNTDLREPVPGHSGVYVVADANAKLDIGVVGAALDEHSSVTEIGVTASAIQVYGSLRRWLAFEEPDSASLSYIGSQAEADASGVPPVIEFRFADRVQRIAPCIPGPGGIAVLDLAAPASTHADAWREVMLNLAVRGFGDAQRQAAVLSELVKAWDAAGRPGIQDLRIDAYPSELLPPDSVGTICHAPHTAFVVSSR